MAGTTTLRPAGRTLGLSVTASSHAAVVLSDVQNDLVGYAACINLGATTVAIKFSQSGLAAVLPGDGTLGDFVLPPAMTQPIVIAIPFTTPQVTAIGSGAGPSLVYITPLVNIS